MDRLLSGPEIIQPYQNGVSVTMDVRLGRQYEFLDVDELACNTPLDELGTYDNGPQATTIHLSADNNLIDHGDYNEGVVTLYMGSILEEALELSEWGKVHRSDPVPANFLVSRIATATIAHELSHRAEDTTIGKEALGKEQRNYELRRIGPRLIPETVGALGLVGLVGFAAITARYADPSPIIKWGITIASTLGLAAPLSKYIAKRFRWIANRHSAYENRPDERRAEARAIAYMKNSDMPLLVDAKIRSDSAS